MWLSLKESEKKVNMVERDEKSLTRSKLHLMSSRFVRPKKCVVKFFLKFRKKPKSPKNVTSSSAREMELNEKAKMSLHEKILYYMW